MNDVDAYDCALPGEFVELGRFLVSGGNSLSVDQAREEGAWN